MLDALDQILRQGEDLLSRLNDENYALPSHSEGSGIGAHYRHCLDHVEQFLQGLQTGRINYDARARDVRVEEIRAVALKKTHEFRTALTDLGAVDVSDPVRIICSVSAQEEDSPHVNSTIGREIMFCVSHTIHHYAIIGMMCREWEVAPPRDFGVAPSTLKYRDSGACAAA